MKYYVIAGEASGDLHAGLLVRELKKLDAEASVRAWGGEKLEEQGAIVVKHYRELAFMGFAEVIRNLPAIMKNFRYCKEDITMFKPDVLVLVDYPGFNLRMAKWAKQQGIKVVYYISPQVWAWKEGRVKQMKSCIDRMIVILPFEKQYFAEKWNWEVDYVGHPLVNVIDEWIDQHPPLDRNEKKPVIALLPGSRRQEILKKLPIMLGLTHHFPDHQFVVAKAPGINESFYDELLKPYPNVSWLANRTYEILSQAKAAIVTSGTATLETALFRVPEVVVYKTSAISYEIGKRVIKVPFISLVNLIMNRKVVNELIQHDFNTNALQKELNSLLNDPARKKKMQEDYNELRTKLSAGGVAPAKAARIIWTFLENSSQQN